MVLRSGSGSESGVLKPFGFVRLLSAVLPGWEINSAVEHGNDVVHFRGLFLQVALLAQLPLPCGMQLFLLFTREDVVQYTKFALFSDSRVTALGKKLPG